MSKNQHMLTVLAARNGFTVRTISGVYVCKTVDELLKEIKAYAPVMQKAAAAEEAN
jgi:hypothetical protein